jgi:hypothetical protein
MAAQAIHPLLQAIELPLDSNELTFELRVAPPQHGVFALELGGAD